MIDQATLELVSPALIKAEEKIYWVHFKAHWKEIQVGYSRDKVRFQFIKHPPTLQEGETIDWKSMGLFTIEVPDEYHIMGKVDTPLYKGVELRLKDISSRDSEFDMS